MKRVLIVDEDTDVLRLLRIKLTAAGYETSLARDGQEALALAEKNEPDVVLMELLLPDMNGLVLLSRLRAASYPAPLVILLSGEGRAEDLSAAFAAGAADYVSKPFSPQALLERIRVNLIRANRVAAGGEV